MVLFIGADPHRKEQQSGAGTEAGAA